MSRVVTGGRARGWGSAIGPGIAGTWKASGIMVAQPPLAPLKNPSMRRFTFLFLLVTLAVWAGCDSNPDTDTYRVTLTDTNGVAVYRGELRLTIEESGAADEPGDVTGVWELEGVGSVPPDSGPLSGSVIGNTSLGRVEMSLVGEASDSGFGLTGTYNGDRMAGEWETITIAGPMPSGTFEAVRE